MSRAKAPVGGVRPFRMLAGISTVSDLADGQTVGSLLGHGGGTAFYLDPTDGNDENDGKSPDKAVKTLTTAFDLTTDGENDVIYYIAGTSSISLEEAFTWDHSYTHLIGVCAPTKSGQRARIFAKAGDNGITPLITVSGSGCVFANLYIFFGVADAHALSCVKVTGGRNYFENVHFAGAGHASNAIDGASSLEFGSGGSENMFVGCQFGVDTVDAATGVVCVLYPSTGLVARNRFIDCDFVLHAGAAGAAFIEAPAALGVDRFHIFDHCRFINTSLTQMTTGMVIASDFGTTSTGNKKFIMQDCWMVGAPQFDTTETHLLVGNMPAVSSADLGGVLVVPHA